METMAMVRILWKQSLMATLLWGGVAWSQQSQTLPNAETGSGNILTLQQAGKPDQRCRILKTAKGADGKISYEVQDIVTGERATITESGSPPAAAEALNPRQNAPRQEKEKSKPATISAPPKPEPKTPTSFLEKLRRTFSRDKTNSDKRSVAAPPSSQLILASDTHTSPDGNQTISTGPAPTARPTETSLPPSAKEDHFATQSASPMAQSDLTMLHSPLPSQREMAVLRLAQMDWHLNPNVVPALVQSACGDPAPSVRAACIRCLAQMNANQVAVRAALQQLKTDSNSNVRHEAEIALAQLVGNK
jgi:hypothetical protein